MSFKKLRNLQRKSLYILALGCASVLSSFGLGLYTADSTVQPISLIEAGSTTLRGDLDRNGTLDLEDVILILEIAQGYRQPTVENVRADPDQNGMLTVDDALRVLAQIKEHP